MRRHQVTGTRVTLRIVSQAACKGVGDKAITYPSSRQSLNFILVAVQDIAL